MFGDSRDEKLKKLLQLKKLEKPTEERWLEFDLAFENRLLSAIKDSRLRRVFSAFTGVFSPRRIACACAGILSILAVFTSGVKMNERVSFMRAAARAREYVKFASDNMFVSESGIDVDSGVRNISYASDGISYVQDAIVLKNGYSMLAKM
ncbi:MAG: hypothetical protein LBI81_01320 [Puniceicoccales bacterium]|jgi:hypothetical protein|nr:hypothetical protein [Puniceicoccales bacterium]